MKQIYHIYYDLSGNVLTGTYVDGSGDCWTLENVSFKDENGCTHIIQRCSVVKNKVLFYFVERVPE